MDKTAVFLVFFAVFWTAIVGYFDMMAGGDVLNALRSDDFRTTTGTVTSNEIVRRRGDDGPRYTAEIRYAYSVAGRKFTSDRYHFSAFNRTDKRWARRLADAHPAGRSVTVYYDADNPALSVLNPGLNGSSLLMLMFLTPFNVVMLGLWWYVLPSIWHWWNGTERPPVRWFRDGGATHVRLPYLPPLATAFGTLGICAFVGLFAVAFTVGFEPSVDTMATAWVLVLGVSVAAGLNIWRMERQGAFDLVIRERIVELPAMYGRIERRTLDRAAISGVAIKTTEYPHSDRSTTYDVGLARRDGGHETVVSWHDGQSAERLAAWLREKLGLR